jgi:hypothetical protein
MTAISPSAYEAFMRDVVTTARARVALKRDAASSRWEFRGNNLVAQTCHDPEFVLVGAAGTGKTLANLVYIDKMMREYSNLRVLIVRKVRADLAESALVTFERDVLGYDNPICKGVQRDTRSAYRYPNGSIMVIAGFDRPGKALSAEYDIVYAVEATQFELTDWEYLTMRIGRTGTFPHPQLRGDTNPDHPDHWLLSRRDEGKLTMLDTYHEDNPAYYDAERKAFTPLGQSYIARLDGLSGYLYDRFRLNKWSSADGAVYPNFSRTFHVLTQPFDIPQEWPRYCAIDFGYTNPFVCQWWAKDPDGRLYMYREIYMTERTVDDHADEIKRLSAGVTTEVWKAMTKDERHVAYAKGERIVATITDHDAEDRATLRKCGIVTTAAKKSISRGQQAVEIRLRVAGDGKARIYFFPNALVETDTKLTHMKTKVPTHTVGEFGGYIWNDKIKKEEPVDKNNHGMDAMRYMVAHFDLPMTDQSKSSKNPFYGHGG